MITEKRIVSFKKRYRDLEMEVLHELRSLITYSKYVSNYINDKAIKIDMEQYVEIAIVNDKLVLIDNEGYQYSIFNLSLEDQLILLQDIFNEEV